VARRVAEPESSAKLRFRSACACLACGEDAFLRHRDNDAGPVSSSPAAPAGAAQRGARRAISVLLQVVGEGSDDEIATETGSARCSLRHPTAAQMSIARSERRLRLRFLQSRRLAFDIWRNAAIMTTARKVSASQSLIGMRCYASGGEQMRYTRPRSSWAEARVSPSFLLQGSENPPNRATVPTHRARHLIRQEGGINGRR
jgi:hypothetical protein